MNRWKLLVEGLGKIERAEVDIHRLMLFVGDNNSGKSYLVSLLWGLLSLSGELPLSHGDAYRRCVAWMEEHFARRAQEPEFEVTPEVHADLVQIMNDTLQEQGRVLAEKTFNRPGFEVGKIELGNVARRDDLRLRWGVDEYPGQPVDTLMITGLRGQPVDTLMINGLRGGELGWKWPLFRPVSPTCAPPWRVLGIVSPRALIRIEWKPFQSPWSASRRFPGGTRRSASVAASWRYYRKSMSRAKPDQAARRRCGTSSGSALIAQIHRGHVVFGAAVCCVCVVCPLRRGW
jgi:hypothetical protein